MTFRKWHQKWNLHTVATGHWALSTPCGACLLCSKICWVMDWVIYWISLTSTRSLKLSVCYIFSVSIQSMLWKPLVSCENIFSRKTLKQICDPYNRQISLYVAWSRRKQSLESCLTLWRHLVVIKISSCGENWNNSGTSNFQIVYSHNNRNTFRFLSHIWNPTVPLICFELSFDHKNMIKVYQWLTLYTPLYDSSELSVAFSALSMWLLINPDPPSGCGGIMKYPAVDLQPHCPWTVTTCQTLQVIPLV